MTTTALRPHSSSPPSPSLPKHFLPTHSASSPSLPVPRSTSSHPPFSPRRHRPGTMLCCPQCRLGVRQRHPEMTIDYCPRCIARARQLVPLLPAARSTAIGRTPT